MSGKYVSSCNSRTEMYGGRVAAAPLWVMLSMRCASY